MKTFVGHLLILSFVICNVYGLKSKFDLAPECKVPGTYSACPEDCSKYYLCFQGRLLRFRCPWGFQWNDRSKKCDRPENANCKEISKQTDVETLVEAVEPVVTEEPKQTAETTGPVEPVEPAEPEAPTESPISETTTTASTPSKATDTSVAAGMEKKKVVCYCA